MHADREKLKINVFKYNAFVILHENKKEESASRSTRT